MDMVHCRRDEAQTSASSANMDEEFWAANTWQVPRWQVGSPHHHDTSHTTVQLQPVVFIRHATLIQAILSCICVWGGA